jgi:microcystin-dependent protein
MSEGYIGEIRAYGFNFAPYNWMFCNGQLLPISSYTALFSIIGTTFGGNGTTNFALPNLQGQIPMHWGTGPSNTVLGQVQGQPTVTLTTQQIPTHTHTATAATGTGSERTASPGPTSYLGESAPGEAWSSASPTIGPQFAPNAISTAGGSIPHNNMQPFLVLNFCICFNGVFPTRS